MLKMWSWVLFVRPSKRRLIPSSESPQMELLLLEDDFFEDDEG